MSYVRYEYPRNYLPVCTATLVEKARNYGRLLRHFQNTWESNSFPDMLYRVWVVEKDLSSDEEIACVYTIGREADSYADLFPKLPYLNADIVDKYVGFYNLVMAGIRRSCLAAFWALRLVHSECVNRDPGVNATSS